RPRPGPARPTAAPAGCHRVARPDHQPLVAAPGPHGPLRSRSPPRPPAGLVVGVFGGVVAGATGRAGRSVRAGAGRRRHRGGRRRPHRRRRRPRAGPGQRRGGPPHPAGHAGLGAGNAAQALDETPEHPYPSALPVTRVRPVAGLVDVALSAGYTPWLPCARPPPSVSERGFGAPRHPPKPSPRARSSRCPHVPPLAIVTRSPTSPNPSSSPISSPSSGRASTGS